MCTEIESGSSCRPPAMVSSLAEQTQDEVARLEERTDPDTGDLVVTKTAGPTVAGTPTRCFRLTFRDESVVGMTGPCFSNSGVPLRAKIERDGMSDTRVATSIREPVTAADVDELIAPFPLDGLAADSAGLPELT